MDFIDYYAVLGVDPTADEKTIKTAYRKLARKFHPDVSKLPDTENKFKEVAQAYEVLHDKNKRAEYDQLLEARKRGFESHRNQSDFQPGFEEGYENPFKGYENQFNGNQDFADFFNSMFGSQESRGRKGQNYDTRHESFNNHKGRDLEMELPVRLEETVTDTTKSIEFFVPYYDNEGQLQQLKKSLNVKIPAGITDGERIRLKGQGAPTRGVSPTGSSTNGDLFLVIRLQQHPHFDIEGNNLILTLPIAPWEAVLGAKVQVPTLKGKIQLSVPSNSQSGQRLRIKGKGLVTKHHAGDLLVALKIVVPKTTSEKAKQLWSQLAELESFEPREWSN